MIGTLVACTRVVALLLRRRKISHCGWLRRRLLRAVLLLGRHTATLDESRVRREKVSRKVLRVRLTRIRVGFQRFLRDTQPEREEVRSGRGLCTLLCAVRRAADSHRSTVFMYIFLQRDGASNTHVPRETAPVEDTYEPYNTIGREHARPCNA